MSLDSTLTFSSPLTSAEAEKKWDTLWYVPELKDSAWLWWFILLFIHDENTISTGICRQLMILWSTKADKEISCNNFSLKIPKPIVYRSEEKTVLNGAAACWFYDSNTMNENFIFEQGTITIDSVERKLYQAGQHLSQLTQKGKNLLLEISMPNKGFELKAELSQKDDHFAIGPNHGRSNFGPFYVEGTRLELLELKGLLSHREKQEIRGTAYFQKILLYAPPPQWYWGIYHFPDGSYLTYMQTFFGKPFFEGYKDKEVSMDRSYITFTRDFLYYDKPTESVYETSNLEVKAHNHGEDLWKHTLSAKENGFSASAVAESYSISTWKFEKKIAFLPIKSRFCYGEYPAVIKNLSIETKKGKIFQSCGWGNMENTWGFLL